MGEVVTVPGMTEDDLREEAIRASLALLGEEPPVLAADEFTVEQWRRAYEERYDSRISDTSARRKLDELVAGGKLSKGERRHPGNGRRIMGYWEVEK